MAGRETKKNEHDGKEEEKQKRVKRQTSAK